MASELLAVGGVRDCVCAFVIVSDVFLPLSLCLLVGVLVFFLVSVCVCVCLSACVSVFFVLCIRHESERKKVRSCLVSVCAGLLCASRRQVPTMWRWSVVLCVCVRAVFDLA